MPEDEKRISAHGRNALQLILFSIGVVFTLLFSFLNIYSLPLGATSVSGALENAESLYGAELSIYGTISQSTSTEFHIHNGTSTVFLDAIWLGEGDVPINGTAVIASGQLSESPEGPVLMCDSVAPESGQPMIFKNPWALPALRLFTVVLVWFIASAFITAFLSLIYLIRPNVLLGNRMRALIEICLLSGSAFFVILLILSFSEGSLAVMPSIPTFGLIASFAVLALSVATRSLKNKELAEIADALPILSGILCGISILAVFIQEQLQSEDLIGSLLSNYLFSSLMEILIGAIGLCAVGIYLHSRRYEAKGSASLLSLIRTEVK